MTAPLLTVESLRKTYPKAGANALDGISFELGQGETLAVVGQSGSGKSTAARCILRLLPATSGRIVFDGRDITRLAGRGLRRLRLEMQIVFQDPKQSFNPRMRLKSSLLEPLRIHNIAPNPVVGDVLEKVGLNTAYLRRFPHELSGGELQRLAIARALVVEPRLIVLDEPVSALDVSVQAQITTLLRELQAATGVSYLFIAHDLAVVRELAHRVAVMRDGRILELQATRNLFADPAHPYTRDLIAASVVTEIGEMTSPRTTEANGHG